MIDSRFHKNKGPFTLGYLADLCGGYLFKEEDREYEIHNVAALGMASAHDISFFHNTRYKEEFMRSKAGACLVAPEYVPLAPKEMRLVLSSFAYRSYGMVASAFYPDSEIGQGHVSPHAFIDPSAQLGEDVFIAPGAVIGAHVVVGRRVKIGAHAVIGEGVEIGEDSSVGPHVVLSHCLVGKKVVFHPGAKVGQPGFGFFADQEGHLKIPQLGRVIIHDDVEVGANTTIDRGAVGDTIIGKGTQIDNLVQIGHNVQTGKGCILVAQVGISGSTHLGHGVVIGGQGGLAGHLRIGNQVKVAAQSGVMRDVADHEKVAGSPAVPVTQWHRQTVILERLYQEKKSKK